MDHEIGIKYVGECALAKCLIIRNKYKTRLRKSMYVDKKNLSKGNAKNATLKRFRPRCEHIIARNGANGPSNNLTFSIETNTKV